MLTRFRRIEEGLPELALAPWLAFAGESADILRQNQAILASHVAALADPFYVASSWAADGRLRGIAVALREAYPDGRHLLTVTLPGALHRAHCRGLWITAGEEPAAVTRELLSTLIEQGGASEAQRLSIAHCPAADPIVPAVGEALGYRPLTAPADHQLQLAPDTTFDGYVHSLGRIPRQGFMRDLRRAALVGAEVTHEDGPGAALLERLWELQLDTYRRKESRLRFTRNLFLELAARLRPEDLHATVCRRGAEVLGFVLAFRAGTVSRLVYIGHVAEPGLYFTLLASLVRFEIERGTRSFFFGTTGDSYKARIGCELIPQLTLYRTLPA